MKTIVRISSILACSVVLIGCAGTGGVTFTPPAGSLVELKQEVAVATGSRLFIQHGRVMQRPQVNVLDPYCHFSLDPVMRESGEELTLKPDTFTITEAYRQRNYVSAAPVQYAGRAGSDRTLATIMELSSATQPGVTRLTCARWGMISDDGWVTIDQMNTTLRGLVEIIVAK